MSSNIVLQCIFGAFCRPPENPAAPHDCCLGKWIVVQCSNLSDAQITLGIPRLQLAPTTCPYPRILKVLMNRSQRLNRFTCHALVCLFCSAFFSTSAVLAAEIELAGELFVDLDAAHPSAKTDLWKNAGTLGDFERVGVPSVATIRGVESIQLNSGSTNDAWQCLDVAPSGLVGQNPTRSVEVWVLNEELAVEEPMVTIGRRGGPNGTCFNFNYGSGAGHGAVTHWGENDVGWGATPQPGIWHHLAVTFDGAVVRVYADGRETNQKGVAPNSLDTQAGSRITLGTGLRSNNELEFGHLRATLAIARVRVHDGVLSSDQIQNNYQVESDELALNKAAASSETATPENLEFFEAKVRPLFAKRCYQCHKSDSGEENGGLHLDHIASILKGGDTGPAIVPGDSENSLLIQAVEYRSVEMPPEAKLPLEEIAIFKKWIELGAPWPDETILKKTVAGKIDWASARQHWSFQPVVRPDFPEINDRSWLREPLDYFVLAPLEANQWKPVEPAERATILRRVYFNLIGLPPSPAETEAFVYEAAPDAWERQIDRLLTQPQYGQRWARHWLDVARYSDGMGGFLDNRRMNDAWRYRDWTIHALNRDLPYDDFVRQQIAGDLVEDEEAYLGTGFLALGPTYNSDGGDPDSIAQAKSETLDDRVDTFSRGFLALTVSCARCHDHKFDPIPTLDYYSLAGVFNNSPLYDRPLVSQEIVDTYNAAQKSINELNDKINKRNSEVTANGRKPTEEEQSEIDQWRADLAELRKNAPPMYPVAHTLRDTGSANMNVALRGNLRKPGEVAPRRMLQVLTEESPPLFSQGSGRRELADAVASNENPLTARVMVNRVWLIHFGRAIVRTPSNFGTLGELPTHPELLDWLAAEFVHKGWSLKRFHRQILSSATYQMSSQLNQEYFNRDGDNRLIWRMNPRRLDVEAWRDALLYVTGEFDGSFDGKPFENLLANRRRTLYSVISRARDRFDSDKFLQLFDFPTPRATSAKRITSVIPQQFLFMLNSEFLVQRSRAFALRVTEMSSVDAERINLAYASLYGRSPTEEEQALGLEFLTAAVDASNTESDQPAQLSPWEQYAQILLSANEFNFIR